MQCDPHTGACLFYQSLRHMARIAKRNRRFRSKDEICRDIAFILSAPVSYGTKFAVLADVVWVWSEFNGKIEGCPFWSRSAARRKSDRKQLMHEHAVPKRVVVEMLFSLKVPTESSVHTVLNHYCIGVVVTREEDAKLTQLGLRSRMPKDWDGSDPWARYAKANIFVVRLKDNSAT